MSDVAMDQPRTNGQLAIPGAPEAAPQEGSSFDIVQILWRWKWLPILGSIVGACLGFLYFSRQPATYEAAALVQVVSSTPTQTRMDFYDPRGSAITRVDESMVIRSQTVLRRAVQLGRLTEQSEFLGMQTDEVVATLMDEESPLIIEPADKDDSTTLIEISYISQDAEVAAKVVSAIVDGYEGYLAEEYKTVGIEIEQLISGARDQLSNRLKQLTQQTHDFMLRAPEVIWTGDEATDPYSVNFLKLNSKITELRVERGRLESVYSQALKAIESGRSPETIMMLLTQLNNASLTALDSTYSQLLQIDDNDLKNRLNSKSAQIEQQILFPLQVEERVLLDSVGAGHPSVGIVQKKVESVKRQIAELRESEQQVDSEMDRMKLEMQTRTGARIRSMEERLTAGTDMLAEQIAALQLEEEHLQRDAAEEKKKSRELQIMLGEDRVIKAELEAVNTLLAGYTEKLQEISLMPKVGQRTLKRLNMPSIGWFYGPTLPKYLLGGAAVGFVLLSGLAVLMDLADRSYRNPSEIATDLGVTVLGHIPVMNISKVKKSVEAVDPSICAIHHSKGRVAEAYRSVRTGLFFSNNGKALKVLQVTSPVPGDGKSTLACNIAVTMAQSGRRVLLIDADLRRPRVAKIFGIDSDVGVAAVVGGKCEIEDGIHVGPVANLSIMPGGKRPANPAEILSSQRFKNMVDVLRDKFDMIVIDTPPLLAVSDPGAVAGIVDGVLMTMRLRRNVKPLAVRAKSILESVGANLLGVVINGVSSEAGYGYNYDYNDYRYAYKYGSNYRSGYGYRYGYGNYRYGYTEDADTNDLSTADKEG
ncbi:polysaccharide biosynthesis tyrosine autokinase [Aureliella helgolandensis]|uniref:non-specific protein-tyrosine kinase n=1 Tax=Aureliella helgolandensis TaxID=2527968 RepID=A0A518GC22_9BACT|nr:polysaccharide biosynthesis tyrosine autokinase [Aureliella helgolandensis]QDV26123.1 Tyrosine-protein kinase YwqD [Aureliella helgolandensis]